MALPVALYPSFPFQRPQLLAYYELLKNLDSKEQLFSAIKEVVKISSFFPTVALIMDHSKGTRIPERFNALELENRNAVPMPERIRELQQFLRHGAKSLDAPNSDSLAVSSAVDTVQS